MDLRICGLGNRRRRLRLFRLTAAQPHGGQRMVRAAVIQMNSTADRESNLARAITYIRTAAAAGAALVSLPETWVWLGEDARKPANSEPLPGPTSTVLAGLAQELGVHIHGGSLLEQSAMPGTCSNTSFLVTPQGTLAAKYRKIHLFDADVEAKAYRESAYVTPGEEIATVPAIGLTCGLSICYDLRFPELYRALADRGAELIFAPAAFTVPTGTAHWSTLVRARAIENQVYMVAAGQVGTDSAGKTYYGHSMIVDPWGEVLAEMGGSSEGMVTAEIDPARIAEVRHRIPALKNRRLGRKEQRS